MISGDRDDVRAGAGQREQRVDDELLGGRVWRGRVVKIARDENRIHLLTPSDLNDLAQHLTLFLEPGPPLKRLPDMPIRSVQEAHRPSTVLPPVPPPSTGTLQSPPWHAPPPRRGGRTRV